MAARIVNLGVNLGASPGRPRLAAAMTARLGAPRPVAGERRGGPPQQHHAWFGASGRSYQHIVYSLIDCPPLPPASYVLVRRDEQGRRVALRVGLGCSEAPTLNLAEVRQSGARAGANEVHVRLAAASDAERRLIACDLRAGLFGTLAAQAAVDA